MGERSLRPGSSADPSGPLLGNPDGTVMVVVIGCPCEKNCSFLLSLYKQNPALLYDEICIVSYKLVSANCIPPTPMVTHASMIRWISRLYTGVPQVTVPSRQWSFLEDFI